MIRALVVSNNVNFIQKLLEEISFYNLEVVIKELATNDEQLRAMLRYVKFSKFEIVIVDKDMPNIQNKELFKDYRKVMIFLAYKKDKNLINLSTLNNINLLTQIYDVDKIKAKATKELEYIGYRLYYTGTQYLLDSIVHIYKSENNKVDNLQTVVYPLIAEKYNKTVRNVKNSISKATDIMYYECDSEKLEKYFMIDEGTKPTVKQVIFTIINKIE